MRRSAPLAVLLTAAAVTGCGGENPRLIPDRSADALIAIVDEAADRQADGRCEQAQESVRDGRSRVQGLPRRVDAGLRANLDEWFVHLGEEIREACREEEPEETPTPSPSPTPTPTPTPTPEPTPTPTPEPTPTPTPEPTPEPPAEQPGDGGVLAPEDDE